MHLPLLSLALCLTTPLPVLAFDPAGYSFRLVELAGGFSQVTDIQSATGEPDRFYVAEPSGRIWILEHGIVDPNPFVDVSSEISTSSSERGLLGFAFSPDWLTDRSLFLNFIGSDGNTRLVEAALTTAAPGDADGEGRLDARDLSWIVRSNTDAGDHAAGPGDCNGDGPIDSSDLGCSLQAIFERLV